MAVKSEPSAAAEAPVEAANAGAPAGKGPEVKNEPGQDGEKPKKAAAKAKGKAKSSAAKMAEKAAAALAKNDPNAGGVAAGSPPKAKAKAGSRKRKIEQVDDNAMEVEEVRAILRERTRRWGMIMRWR
jgi:hypothetical protein